MLRSLITCTSDSLSVKSCQPRSKEKPLGNLPRAVSRNENHVASQPGFSLTAKIHTLQYTTLPLAPAPTTAMPNATIPCPSDPLTATTQTVHDTHGNHPDGDYMSENDSTGRQVTLIDETEEKTPAMFHPSGTKAPPQSARVVCCPRSRLCSEPHHSDVLACHYPDEDIPELPFAEMLNCKMSKPALPPPECPAQLKLQHNQAGYSHSASSIDQDDRSNADATAIATMLDTTLPTSIVEPTRTKSPPKACWTDGNQHVPPPSSPVNTPCTSTIPDTHSDTTPTIAPAHVHSPCIPTLLPTKVQMQNLNTFRPEAITTVPAAITSPDLDSKVGIKYHAMHLNSTTDDSTLTPKDKQDMSDMSTQHIDPVRATGPNATGTTLHPTIGAGTESLDTQTAVVSNSLQDHPLPPTSTLIDRFEDSTEKGESDGSPTAPKDILATDPASANRSIGNKIHPHTAVPSVLTEITCAFSNTDSTPIEMTQHTKTQKQPEISSEMPTVTKLLQQETFLAYRYMQPIFSSIDNVLSHHRSVQSLPAPMELASTTAHLLAASDCLSHDEFEMSIAKLLRANGEGIIRLYKQALLSHFIHLHDLCVVPDAWLQEHDNDKDPFLTEYNFLEDVDGTRYRFDLAPNLFRKISRLRRGKGKGKRQTCKEKKMARGKAMLIILTQILRIIDPTLSLDVDCALIIAGYDNLAGTSQFSRHLAGNSQSSPRPFPKHKLLKTSTAPAPMATLYMRTKMAVANYFTRRKIRQPNCNSPARINKLTKDDAAIWRTYTSLNNHNRQPERGPSDAASTLSTLEDTNGRKRLPSTVHDNNSSPQPPHKKRRCGNMSKPTAGADPANLPTATEQDQIHLAAIKTLASLRSSVAGRGKTTITTPPVQQNIANAGALQNAAVLNCPMRIPHAEHDTHDDNVPSDESQDAVGCSDDSNAIDTIHKSPPQLCPDQTDPAPPEPTPPAPENDQGQTEKQEKSTEQESESNNTDPASQPTNGLSAAVRKLPPKSPKKPAAKRKNNKIKPKRKPPVRREFRTEDTMPELALIHDVFGSNEVYMCYDRMVIEFRKYTADMHYWTRDDADLVRSLEPTEVIAISGHILGYSSVWSARQFNEWVFLCINLRQDQVNYSDDETGALYATTMYKDARHCRFIVEADMIRLAESTRSQLGTKQEHGISKCPSSQPSIGHGLVTIPLGSPARFHASFAGNVHLFDSAKWVFGSIVDPTLPGDVLSSKLLSSRMAQRQKMLRAETLEVLINDVLLRYLHPRMFRVNKHAAMQIAGYPSLDGHKLPDKYINTVSPRCAKFPPVNMETLFARTSIAIAKCKSREYTTRKNKKGTTSVVITRKDAVAWREDPHLQTNKVPCLFQRQPTGDMIAHHKPLHHALADVSI
jgi:hypothetical protein